MRKLWKFSEIGLDIVGVEGAAVEKAVAADRQAALRRARADRFVEPAFEFRTRAGQGRTGACRSEKRRVGTECANTCRSRWSAYHSKIMQKHRHLTTPTLKSVYPHKTR